MAAEHECLEQKRFERIENDIRDIKEDVKVSHIEIQGLKEYQAETKVYVRQIFERMDDIKAMIKSASAGGESGDRWLKVVLELIKAIGVVGAIIAGIKLIG
jgi:hypothetical protein